MNNPELLDAIVNYLHLEYGESPDDPESLKKEELKYAGEFMYEGSPTHFWWYPSGQTQCWAIVYTMDDVECIGMTTDSPDSLERIS